MHATLDQLREAYADLYAEAEAISRSSVVAAEQRARRPAPAPAGPAGPAPGHGAAAPGPGAPPTGCRTACAPRSRRGCAAACAAWPGASAP